MSPAKIGQPAATDPDREYREVDGKIQIWKREATTDVAALRTLADRIRDVARLDPETVTLVAGLAQQAQRRSLTVGEVCALEVTRIDAQLAAMEPTA